MTNLVSLSNTSNGFSVNNAASSSSTADKKDGASGLQDRFLTLLVAQMRNQDPLNPVSGSDFVAQLAQFSTLQGQQQLNTNINQMLVLQQVTQGASLIGKQITFDAAGKALPASGTVSAVQVNNGAVQLVVGNQTVALTQVRSITSNGK